jgi:hypothetical protein
VCIATAIGGLVLALVLAACGAGGDPAPPAPRPAAAERADTYDYPREGYSVDLPPGWHRAEGPVTRLVDPRERLVAATYAPRAGNEECGPLEFGGFTADDSLVVVLERARDQAVQSSDFPPRPAHFAYEPEMTSEFTECLRSRRGIALKDHWFTFSDAGRRFHVLVAIGADAPPGTERDAYGMLDSLRFDPSVKPDWPSAG